MNTSRRAAGFFTQGSPGTKGNDNKSREAAKKWAETLDLPEDQAIPCVVAFACLRYHRKIICPQTGKRDRGDHDLAIVENRRGPVPVGPRPEERPLGRAVPDHEVRPEVEGR